MMLRANWVKYILNFNFLAKTSRDSLRQKETWFLFLKDENNNIGIGECNMLKGLSPDDPTTFEKHLELLCTQINEQQEIQPFDHFPAIQFGYEMASIDLRNKGNRILFPSTFTQSRIGIKINGLVWMGTYDEMLSQIETKLKEAYSVIKLKIGAIDFISELRLLANIRKKYSTKEVEICVDANGAFLPNEAPKKLAELAKYDLHSIEQPIKAGNWRSMQDLCHNTPIPIALDEELIGIVEKEKKKELLKTINPQYIILKPSLLGGFSKSEEWIELANEQGIEWWITSLLESNIGLSAIAQWTAKLAPQGHQGLGTGQLYNNNFPSPLFIKEGKLFYKTMGIWDLSAIQNQHIIN